MFLPEQLDLALHAHKGHLPSLLLLLYLNSESLQLRLLLRDYFLLSALVRRKVLAQLILFVLDQSLVLQLHRELILLRLFLELLLHLLDHPLLSRDNLFDLRLGQLSLSSLLRDLLLLSAQLSTQLGDLHLHALLGLGALLLGIL